MSSNAASGTCPSCHASVHPGERFCGNCGTAIPASRSDAPRSDPPRTCDRCGASLTSKARFCPVCGAPATPVFRQPPPTMVAPPPTSPPVQSSYPPAPYTPAPPPPLPVSPYPAPVSRPVARQSPLPAVLLTLCTLLFMCVAAWFIANRILQDAVDILSNSLSSGAHASFTTGVGSIFDNTAAHPDDLKTGPATPARFTVNQAWKISEIQDTHWNDGSGATPGAIGLRAEDGAVYGPWPAAGMTGHASSGNDVPNAVWVVKPNLVIQPGTYTILDSDPDTWSHSATSDSGIARVMGVRQ